MIYRKIATKFYLNAMAFLRRKRSLIKTCFLSLGGLLIVLVAVSNYSQPEQNSTARTILEDHMFETMDTMQTRPNAAPPQSCDNRSNRTLITYKFRNLMQKMVRDSVLGLKSSVSAADTCHLPKDILVIQFHHSLLNASFLNIFS